MIRIVVNDNDVNCKVFCMLIWENMIVYFYGLIEWFILLYFCFFDFYLVFIVSFVYCEEDLVRMV